MTNGEKFKQIFSITQVDDCDLNVYAWLPIHDAIEIPVEWWNAEYNEPTTKNLCDSCGNSTNCMMQSGIVRKECGLYKPTSENDLGVDCIDRQATLDAIIKRLGIKNESYLLPAEKTIYQQIKDMPSVTPQEPKTGHWIKYCIPRAGEQHYQCTNCEEYFNFGLYSDYYKKAFKFCPNCGCAMVESQESEEA